MSSSPLLLIVLIVVPFCLGTNESDDHPMEEGTFCLGGEALPFAPQSPAPFPPPATTASSSQSAANVVQMPPFVDQSLSFEDDEFYAYCYALLCQNEMQDRGQCLIPKGDYGDQFLTAPESVIGEKVPEKSVHKQAGTSDGKVPQKGTELTKGKKKAGAPDRRAPTKGTELTKGKKKAGAPDRRAPEAETDLANIVRRVDHTVERFVANSNKMWSEIRAQLTAVEMEELMEKQKALAAEGHNGLSKYGSIEADFKATKNAMIMAGRVADIAVVGIGISLFLIGVEMQSQGVRLNDFLMEKPRWIACRLVQVGPMFDAFTKIIGIFGERFNAKCQAKAEYANDCMANVKVDNWGTDRPIQYGPVQSG